MTTTDTNEFTPEAPGVKPPPVDVHLSTLLSTILGVDDENDESSFGLTLMTPGGTISGTARTRSAWVKAQTEMLEGLGGPGGEYAAKVIRIVDEKFKGLTDENGESLVHRGFINLQDARLLNGGVTVQYPWIRVDMNHIVAWSLGVPSPGNE